MANSNNGINGKNLSVNCGCPFDFLKDLEIDFDVTKLHSDQLQLTDYESIRVNFEVPKIDF